MAGHDEIGTYLEDPMLAVGLERVLEAEGRFQQYERGEHDYGYVRPTPNNQPGVSATEIIDRLLIRECPFGPDDVARIVFEQLEGEEVSWGDLGITEEQFTQLLLLDTDRSKRYKEQQPPPPRPN
jgi:hypothetical protein